MAGAKKTQLLPLGETIQNGQLKIERRLDAGLTAEVYEGYLEHEGQKVRVAVKAMKALEFSAARQLFMQETETLAFLMHLEEEANREQGISLKVAPVYYGRAEYEDTPYFVMEFVEGKKIPKALQEAEGGKFSELQALTAAWHLYRTLDVMHRLLQKTYIDLKFENLWWVDGNEKHPYGQLKLTDFGTLEEIKPADEKRRGVARDLLLAAVYFCKMATGYTPGYSLGELRRFHDLKTELQKAQVTWGVKRELKRLLHRDPSQRPHDAGLIAAGLRTLVDFWTLTPQKVLEVARKALDRAQADYDEKQELSSKGRDAAYRAKSAFEILAVRAPDIDTSHEQERLQTLLKSTDHLELGKNLLRGRSYDLAKKVFQEGMIWEENAATLRRWAYLAELGENISPTAFESIQSLAFEMLEKIFPRGLWDDALREIENIRAKLGSAESLVGLNYLFAEANLFREAELADAARDEKRFAEAGSHYRTAQSFFEKLPDEYQDNIRENDLGDLKQNIIDMLEEAQALERKKALDEKFDRAVSFFREHGFDEDGKTLFARREAESAVREAIALGYHVERLHEITRAALENKNYLAAYRLAQTGLLGSALPEPFDSEAPKLPKILSDDLNLSANLFHAQQALEIPDGELFSERLREALPFIQSDEIAKVCVDDLLDQAEQKAKTLQSANLYFALGKIYKELDSARADEYAKIGAEVQKKQSAERRNRVEVLVAEAKALQALSLEEFTAQSYEQTLPYALSDVLRIAHSQKERYEYIRQVLQAAEALATTDGYRLHDIRDALEKLQKEIDALARKEEETANQRFESYENALAALNRWWHKLEPLAQWRERSIELFGESDASRAIHQQLFGEAADFLAACYSALQGAAPSFRLKEKLDEEELVPPQEPRAAIHVLIENAHRLLNSLGPDAWRAIQKQSADVLQKIDSFLNDAKTAFEEGNFPRAQALLEQAKIFSPGVVESPEWKALCAQTLRVSLWNKWRGDHGEILSSARYDSKVLEDIRRAKKQEIPAVYFETSGVDEYLNHLDKALNDALRAALGDLKSLKFLDVLREWLDVSWTLRYHAASDSLWSATNWLNAAYPLIQLKDSDKLAELVRNAPLPEHIPSALASVNPEQWKAVVSHKEQQCKQEQKRQAQARRNFMLGSAAAGVLCVLLAFGAFLSRRAIWQMAYGTYTPTPTVTSTVTPTFTPTATATPTGTFTPTPIPASIFLVPNASSVRPALPVAAEQVWVLLPENASVRPSITDKTIWTKETSADDATKGEIYYSTQKQIVAQWQTDQPLYEGLYAVFVLDTKSKSGGTPPLGFQIFSDTQPLNPLRGSPVAMFKSTSQKQTADEWIPLGVYQLESGRKLGVRVDVPALQKDAFFALSKLAIVKVTDSQRALYEALPAGRVLASLADDTSAVVLDAASQRPLSNYQGNPAALTSSWGGTFRSLPLDSLKGISQKVTVQWTLPGALPAGKYQLLAWIPSNGATAQGKFFLLANGKRLEKQTPPAINQKDHSDVWWMGDIWTLTDTAAITVQFVVDPALQPGGFLGIDAVALVKAD